ncbi:MAG: hemolysin family protein [Clostridia bacterium]
MEAGHAPVILTALLVLIVINAAFVAAKAGGALRRDKHLEELVARGLSRAEAALAAAREVQRLHEAANLVTTLVLALVGWWGVPLLYRSFSGLFDPLLPAPARAAAAGALAVLVAAGVHLVFVQILPERWAARFGPAPFLRGAVSVVHKLAQPFLWLVYRTAAGIGRLTGARRPGGEGLEMPPGSPGMIALASRGRGSLGATQREILQAYFDYRERPVEEVMIPLKDVASVASTMRIREVRDAVRHFGFTRYPVYDAEPDRIIGFVHFRELVEAAEVTPRAPVTDVMHSTVTVSSRAPVSEALQAMQSRGCPLAVVADERGATLGIVTVEDLLIELLAGDGRPPGQLPPSVEVAAGVYEVDAALPVEEVEDLLDVDLDHVGFETLGGFVSQRLGRKPKIGDAVRVSGLVFEVIGVRGARVTRIRVQRTRQAPRPWLAARRPAGDQS